ncbi:NUDIX hydrolase [Allorhizocola rhizosphaerae]|uniref:NUDIX hydrolase n=1 Tax=Allorhizocola rhizosphaerae TaxID=1872709 RepID=UPI000E3E625C|nr:NUDIX domain-containing protein [Allorhizocola rhizosphaerae]
MYEPSRHSVSVAAVVTDRLGHVLVIKRRDNGAWQVPGGVLELGETIEHGLSREVLEETGISVRPTRLTGVYKNMAHGIVTIVMHAEPVAGQACPTDEAAEVAWWTPQQAMSEMSEAFAVRVRDALHAGIHPAIRHHDGTNLVLLS